MSAKLTMLDIADICGRSLDRVRHWPRKYNLAAYGGKSGKLGEWEFTIRRFEAWLDTEGIMFLTVDRYEKAKEKLEQLR